MCGINGILNKKSCSRKSNSMLIQEMNDVIIHRGPDDDGIFIENNVNYCLGMGMRRLSIIDLNSGKQPISTTDNSITIVFNGEIYNYKQLRKELIENNIQFKTSSDTEVILKMYEMYGTNSFSRLDGMFAFSIYDKNIGKLFIARDFFGEKPLYYYKKNNSFYWASELKSILKILSKKPIISKEALSLYFQLTYIPAPYSIYEGVKKLEPNHFLEISCDSVDVKQHKIKENSNKEEYKDLSFEVSKKITHDLVQESVASRAVSDVPIGTFLSGGVDSSIVSLALSKHVSTPIDTFSIGFEKKIFDESNKSKTIAKLIGSKHHEFMVTEADLKSDIFSILSNFDEPFADSSALPTYLVSKLTSNQVKVALTGDGGDEVFGGYNKYYIGKLNQKYTHIISKNTHKYLEKWVRKFIKLNDDSRGIRFKMNRLMKAINYENEFYYNIISLGFQKNELPYLLNFNSLDNHVFDYYKVGKVSSIKDFRNVDKILSLEGDLLVKVDRTSMLASLECRAPFLNKELWNFTNQLPDSYLMKGWNKKYILKESFKEYFPKGFLNKSKKGFGVPVGDWLRLGLKKELLTYVDKYFLEKQNIFNIDYVQNLVFNHIEGREDNTFRVWTFYCFQKWYKTHF